MLSYAIVDSQSRTVATVFCGIALCDVVVIIGKDLQEGIFRILGLTIGAEAVLEGMRLAYDGIVVVGEAHLFGIEGAVAFQFACRIYNLVIRQEGGELVLTDILEPCIVCLVAVQLVAERSALNLLEFYKRTLCSGYGIAVGAGSFVMTEEVFVLSLVRHYGSAGPAVGDNRSVASQPSAEGTVLINTITGDITCGVTVVHIYLG